MKNHGAATKNCSFKGKLVTSIHTISRMFMISGFRDIAFTRKTNQIHMIDQFYILESSMCIATIPVAK